MNWRLTGYLIEFFGFVQFVLFDVVGQMLGAVLRHLLSTVAIVHGEEGGIIVITQNGVVGILQAIKRKPVFNRRRLIISSLNYRTIHLKAGKRV